MKNKNLFTKFIQAIFLALSIINLPTQATFYNAICLATQLPKNKQQHVQLFADMHIGNADMSNQADPIIEQVMKDPENSCVIVETDETCATPKVSKRHKAYQVGQFFYIANACKEKNVETQCIDFRICFDPETNEIVSLPQTPEKFSVVEFFDTVGTVVNACDKYLTEEQKSFWQNLQEFCKQENLMDLVLEDLFNYKSTPTSETLRMSIVWFMRTLVDANIIKSIKESDKENIYVVAGGFHTENVYNYLQKNGYTVCCERGISHEESISIFDQYPDNPIKLAANIPQVNIREYFNDMADHTKSENIIQIFSPTIVT